MKRAEGMKKNLEGIFKFLKSSWDLDFYLKRGILEGWSKFKGFVFISKIFERGSVEY